MKTRIPAASAFALIPSTTDRRRRQPALMLLPPLPPMPAGIPQSEAAAVVDFWSEAGPDLWFAKYVDFDWRFAERFLAAHEAPARRELAVWMATARGALALVLLDRGGGRHRTRGYLPRLRG